MQPSLFINNPENGHAKKSNLFSRLLEFDNFHRAYTGARQGKRYRSSILKFGCNLEENLLSLRDELKNKTYKHGGYREFIVNDSKKRLIKAAPFRDRVVHHALCNIIEPLLDKGFIYDSYACRKEKGVHSAILRLEYFVKAVGFLQASARRSFVKATEGKGEREREREMARFAFRSMAGGERFDDGMSSRSTHPGSSINLNSGFRLGGRNDKTIYCLKCDIAKYFDNVDHEVLFGLLCKKIWDKDILWLLREIIESNTKGIPIGNLTSQLFANIYLNELDHFVKRELKERYYIRYMDDFLILGTDKKHLAVQKEKIREFLREKLKLELHPRKAEIFPIFGRLDFLGYVLRDNMRFLRKSTVKRFIKRRKRYARLLRDGKISKESIESSEKSWLGYAKFADSWGLRKKLGI